MIRVSGPREYCQWETFTAECPDGEILLMKNGVYGRMHLGRCVKNDFGYIGCGSDVLDQVRNSFMSLFLYIKFALKTVFIIGKNNAPDVFFTGWCGFSL